MRNAAPAAIVALSLVAMSLVAPSLGAWAQSPPPAVAPPLIAPRANPAPMLPAPAGQPPPARRPDPRRAEIDALFAKLKAAPTEEAAGAIEEQIKQKWVDAGSAATTLLLSKGVRNLRSESGDDAVGDFDAALVLEPELHIAFSYRARAKFLVGDYPGALRDTQAALLREPRNFMALQGLSRIAEARGDLKGALLAWQKMLEIDPKAPESEKRLRELNRKVNGEST